MTEAVVMEAQTFTGIADAHGIESFMPIKKAEIGNNNFYFMMRAQTNRQRHALVYKVTLLKDDVDKINKLLKNYEYKGALEFIKEHNVRLEVEKQMTRSWEMLPNDELDPYWSPK